MFEASSTDLMAGQQSFGQLEGAHPARGGGSGVAKKVISYIPNILQIALSGTHQGQAASVLDQILPAISAGRLIVWTEASPTSAARLLQLRPALRGTPGRGDPAGAAVAGRNPAACPRPRRAVVGGGRFAHRCGLRGGGARRGAAVSERRQLPGTVLDLIKLTVGRAAKDGSERVDPHGVILTLSQLTGLPASILDNKERVDLAAIRGYFSARVMGQDEAVNAVVERIAMLKAGLNDPGKPIGVSPVRRADGYWQDRACQDGGRIPVWVDGPPDPPRHERAADAQSPP